MKKLKYGAALGLLFSFAGAAQAATCQLKLATDEGKQITYFNASADTDEWVVIKGNGQVFPVRPSIDLELQGASLHTLGCQTFLDEGNGDSVNLSINCDGIEASTSLSQAVYEGRGINLSYQTTVTPAQTQSLMDMSSPDISVRVNLELTCVK